MGNERIIWNTVKWIHKAFVQISEGGIWDIATTKRIELEWPWSKVMRCIRILILLNNFRSQTYPKPKNSKDREAISTLHHISQDTNCFVVLTMFSTIDNPLIFTDIIHTLLIWKWQTIVTLHYVLYTLSKIWNKHVNKPKKM